MPELPEVETIVRDLAGQIEGRRIEAVDVFCARIVRHNQIPLEEALPGEIVRSIRRHGKHIRIDLQRGTLTLHLGMTGKLLMNTAPGPHTRAIFTLSPTATLLFDDIRTFGSIEFHRDGLPPRLSRLGDDPFEISPEAFFERLREHRTSIKALLLNQTLVRGVGNIYADEALFAARIHPGARCHRLTRARAAVLLGELRRILAAAIEARGSSISDYVDASGRQGSFQKRHQVYGREAEPCPRCSTPIRKIVLAQRGTHFCPRCQQR